MATTVPDPSMVKRVVIEAIGSEPFLVARLVFKGGSALELLYGIGLRASVDLDFSIEGDFEPGELPIVRERFEEALGRAFGHLGFRVFDVRIDPKPPEVSADLAHFWGGYGVRFKIISRIVAEQIGEDIEALRRNATTVGPAQRRTFEIDISRHELCRDKEPHTLDGVTVFAYPPRLIVAEKLRAICQQRPEYRAAVRSPGGRPRARDFFDIHNLIDRFSLVLATVDFRRLMIEVFDAKRVPLHLLGTMETTRELHRTDFQAVLDTVPAGIRVLTFDEYFDSVLTLVRRLQALGNE